VHVPKAAGLPLAKGVLEASTEFLLVDESGADVFGKMIGSVEWK